MPLLIAEERLQRVDAITEFGIENSNDLGRIGAAESVAQFRLEILERVIRDRFPNSASDVVIAQMQNTKRQGHLFRGDIRMNGRASGGNAQATVRLHLEILPIDRIAVDLRLVGVIFE